MEEFKQMNIETLAWHGEQLWENYNIDVFSQIGQSFEEYANDSLEEYTALKPPEGILYILEVDEKAAGMGAITKHNEIGELHRMWNRPEYRGKGYGKQMVSKLLEAGTELGCTRFRLSTPKFAYAAQHVYKSKGFKETQEYQESPVPPSFRQYWIYMEKQ
jgi:GNAT superfamily N-acetyltransferase